MTRTRRELHEFLAVITPERAGPMTPMKRVRKDYRFRVFNNFADWVRGKLKKNLTG